MAMFETEEMLDDEEESLGDNSKKATAPTDSEE